MTAGAGTAPRAGRIVAAYGRTVTVEDTEGERHRCRLKGRRLRPVCADNVQWRAEAGDGSNGTVTEILPRRTVLARPDKRGRAEVLAANISQLLVVIAPRPQPDPGLVDRYLVAAELSGIDAALVANKTDIELVDLDEFRAIGYRCAAVSAKDPSTLDPLLELLRDQVSILVGQSGAGKSSLLNALIPGLESRTQALSSASGEGRHTTTASILHHIDNGGEVIDSPGVRDFAPPPVDELQLASGFREFSKHAQHCRFANCRHLAEPGCEVKSARDDGLISARRYESYCALIKRMAQLSGLDYS